MKLNEVGALIRRGYSIKEIREVVKDFPINPDLKYLEDLGYSKGTAQNYLYWLRRNCERDNNSEAKCCFDQNMLIFSKNADINNIILDTSALGRKSCRDAIDKSNKVIVLYCIIREFDKVLKNDEKSDKIKNPIKTYVDKMIGDQIGKFKVVPYKYKDTREADDIIIDYILEQSITERPTILTADKRLALKAKCFGFDYILYSRKFNHYTELDDEEDEEDKDSSTNLNPQEKLILEELPVPEWKAGEKAEVKSEDTVIDLTQRLEEKEYGSGVYEHRTMADSEKNENIIIHKMGLTFSFDGENIELKRYNYGAKVFTVVDNICHEITTNQIEKNFDYFAVMCKIKKYGVVKISKILMDYDEVKVVDYECSCINEIYSLENEFQDEILEALKDLLV